MEVDVVMEVTVQVEVNFGGGGNSGGENSDDEAGEYESRV